MALVYFVLFLLGVLIAYLCLSLLAGRPLFGFRPSSSREGRGEKGGAGPREGRVKTCPICGTLLAKGQRVKSVVFRGGVRTGTVTEKMSHIFGCPFCFPPNSNHIRMCPVCGKEIPPEGYLVARMFDRTDRPRKHVHVLGCTVCRNK